MLIAGVYDVQFTIVGPSHWKQNRTALWWWTLNSNVGNCLAKLGRYRSLSEWFSNLIGSDTNINEPDKIIGNAQQ